jgi:hypothetical protein
MAKTLVITGLFSLPNEDGQPAAPINLAQNIVYTQKASFDLSYDAPVTDDVIDLGTLATGGARGLLIKGISGAATVKFNADTLPWPVSVGSVFLYANAAQGFPTGVKITTTGPAQLTISAVA